MMGDNKRTDLATMSKKEMDKITLDNRAEDVEALKKCRCGQLLVSAIEQQRGKCELCSAGAVRKNKKIKRSW